MLIQRTDITFDRTGLPALPNIYPYPLQLGALVKGWWSTDFNAVLSGSNVSSWTDRTSLATKVSALASPQPIVYTASAQNGLPGMQTAQTSNSAATAAVLYTSVPVPALGFEWNLPMSISIAMKAGAFGGSSPVQPMVAYSVLSSTGSFQVFSSFSGQPSIRLTPAAGGGISLASNPALVNGTTYHMTFTYDGSGNQSGLKIYNNGVLVGTGSGGTPISTTLNSAASAFRLFSGYQGNTLTASPDMLFEVVLTGAALTQAQVTSMDSYLNKKWALHS